ncbi:MAG: ISAs1 family transposase [Synechococcaceae cyanobacterium]
MAIKGSRRKAFQLIRDRLTYGKRQPFQARVSECGHGRTSTWTLRATEAPTTIKEIWPGSALIIAVQSVGKGEGRPIEESRYYVFAERTYRCDTSLRTTAKALLQHVRDRWSIETSWHWVRDTQLREDAHRYRERNGVQVLAGLRTVALNLLRLNGFRSIADALGAVSHNVALLLRLMRGHELGGAQSASTSDFE